MSSVTHPRVSWPERAPRPRRTVRDYTDVFVVAVMVCILCLYGVAEHNVQRRLFRGEKLPRFPHRVLAFAVTNSVGWNTGESEGEIVTTKGLKGFETSYEVYFGDARDKRDQEVSAELNEGTETETPGLLDDTENETGLLDNDRSSVSVGGPTNTNSGVGSVLN